VSQVADKLYKLNAKYLFRKFEPVQCGKIDFRKCFSHEVYEKHTDNLQSSSVNSTLCSRAGSISFKSTEVYIQRVFLVRGQIIGTGDFRVVRGEFEKNPRDLTRI
jgi:hypothetical protein